MAESGTLEGKVKDSQGEPIPFVTILLFKGESVVSECSTDLNGKYEIKEMPSGDYVLKADCPGFAAYRDPSVNIQADKITYLDVTMQQGIEPNS